MSDFKLALAYLKSRILVTVLTVLAVSLGLALGTIVLSLSRQASDTLRNEAGFWDLVIAAKGSPLQAVLNGLYYLEPPTGNIDVKLWDKLKRDPNVATVVPVNMGDNYYGQSCARSLLSSMDAVPSMATTLLPAGANSASRSISSSAPTSRANSI